MAVGTQATSLNGWFGGRCALLMFLCNKGPSNDFFLDDFCRSLLPLSVLPEPLEKVRQLSPFACFLIAPLYTQSGMVSVFAIGVCYNACRDRMCSIRKANFLCLPKKRDLPLWRKHKPNLVKRSMTSI